jgi:hypothetical protein
LQLFASSQALIASSPSLVDISQLSVGIPSMEKLTPGLFGELEPILAREKGWQHRCGLAKSPALASPMPATIRAR